MALHTRCQFKEPETLAQIEYFDSTARVDFVDSVEGLAARLPVQIVALEKDCVVAEAPHVHATIRLALQLHALADRESCSLHRLVPVDVGDCAETEAVFAGRVKQTVDHH
jgi:hypothetical protein